MFVKSQRSAFIMAFITAFMFSVTTILLSFVTGYDIVGKLHPLVMLALDVIVLAVVIGLGGMLIHQQLHADLYYGLPGAVRWAALGLVWAVIMQVSYALEGLMPGGSLLEELIQSVAIVLAFLVIFKILPALTRKDPA